MYNSDDYHMPPSASEPQATGDALPPHTGEARKRKRSGCATPLLLLLGVLLFGGGLFAGLQMGNRGTGIGAGQQGTTIPPSSAGANVSDLREQVVARVRPSVVQINVNGDAGSGLGSGVIIDKRGYIITNNHVVEGAKDIQVVLFDGSTLPGKLVGTAPADDLAVVLISSNERSSFTVATLGDSSQLQVGQDVMAIGNPLGITQTVTNGIVSALGRNVATGENSQILPGTIQTDAAINPGNSGGALVDLQGNLIGIPTLTAIDPQFKTPANGVGFAIPSNRVRFIAPQLIGSGKVTKTGRAALEVQVVDVDPVVAQQNKLPVQQGVLIVSLTPGGAAEKAGLKVNDIIVQVDNKPVNNVLSLGDSLISKSPGDTVAVKIYRGNQQLTINVKLGELPAR